MIFTKTGYEDLIKYANGEILPEDSAEFHKKLNIENNLKNKLNCILEIENHLMDLQLSDFRKTVKDTSYHYRVFTNKHRNKNYFLANFSNLNKAASILILVTISLALIYIYTPKYSASQKIFKEYYQPYEENITTRAIVSQMGNFQLAIEAYKNKEYNKSINYFNKVIVISSSVNLYKGIACIECKNYNEALISLQFVLNNPDSTYYSQAHWFLALTWLKLDKPRNSIPSLKWLKNNDRFYSRKASEILNKLQ